MKTARIFGFVLMLGVAAGCAKNASVAAGSQSEPVTGAVAKPGSALAYEHGIWFQVAPDSMSRRVTAVQTACTEERFGACSVLAIELGNGGSANADASIKLRSAPQGVEPLVALAAEGKAIWKRQTSAEDLADAVADVAGQQEMLRRQRERLLGYLQRKDVAVADMIAVSQQLASIESSLQALGQQSADQQRRIETNLLTITLFSDQEADSVSDVSFGEAWSTFVDSLAEGLTAAAEYAGFLLPLALLLFPMALLWRWGWRWATRRSRSTVSH